MNDLNPKTISPRSECVKGDTDAAEKKRKILLKPQSLFFFPSLLSAKKRELQHQILSILLKMSWWVFFATIRAT